MKKVIHSKDLMPTVKELIDEGLEVQLTVSGNSMYPFYKDRETMVTLSKPIDLKIYDVVLFIFDGKYYLHRIIKIKDYVWIKGDHNTNYEYVKIDEIIAKVINHSHKQKTIQERSWWYLLKVRMFLLLSTYKKKVNQLHSLL